MKLIVEKNIYTNNQEIDIFNQVIQPLSNNVKLSKNLDSNKSSMVHVFLCDHDVFRLYNTRVYIRSNEQSGHNKPHVHVEVAKKDAGIIYLDTLTFDKTSLPINQQNAILNTLKTNYLGKAKETWNKIISNYKFK